MSLQRKAQFRYVGPCLVFVGFVWYQLFRLSATNLQWSKAAVWRGLSLLNNNLSQRRTGDIWVGSAKHNSKLLVPVWSSSASLSATNCWVQKSARLYNNCKYSGVGSDCGRGDLYNVIFNSLDIHHVFVSILVIRKGPTPFSLFILLLMTSSERVQPPFHYFHRVVPLTTLVVRTTGG